MKLGEACFLKSGKNITAKEIYVSPKDNLYPCYGGNGLRGYVDKYNYEGDYNLIGRQGALCGNINRVNGKFYATEHAVVVTPLISLDIDWLYFALVGMDLNQYHTGAAQPGLNIDILNNLEIDVPIIGEQIAQATVLNKINGMIRNRKRELEKLDDLIKARFVELFGDPVLNEKGWDVRSFLDMGDCKNGMNFHYDDSGVELNCLGVGDFKDNSIIDNTSVLPMVSLNEMPSDEYLLRDDDIVFVRSNGNKALVGRSVAVYPGTIPTIFSGFCIRYRKHDENITIPYLLRVLKTDSIRKKMAGRGANIQNLNQKILGELVIPIPPLDLQKQFSDFVTQVDKSKIEVQKSLDEAQLLFDSLMQQYFG